MTTSAPELKSTSGLLLDIQYSYHEVDQILEDLDFTSQDSDSCNMSQSILTMSSSSRSPTSSESSASRDYDLDNHNHDLQDSDRKRIQPTTDGANAPLFQLDNDEDSSSSLSCSVKPKKKRIRTNRRLYPFPRIVKRDIRRVYPGMLANVMNSGDLALLSSFLTEFSIKKCQFTDYFPGSEGVNLSWNRSFQGVSSVIQYFSSFWTPTAQALIPDFQVKVRWASVKQFLNQEHSELTCGLTFSATPIFDLSLLLASLQPKNASAASTKQRKTLKSAAAKPASSVKKRKLGDEDVSVVQRPYRHTQTLYLTPDMDPDYYHYDNYKTISNSCDQDYNNANNGSFHFDGMDDNYYYDHNQQCQTYPSLSVAQGQELVQLAQIVMNMSSSAVSPSTSHTSSSSSSISSIMSFLSTPMQEIRYEGMVTFRLDGKCQIESLEFGPEVQRHHNTTVNNTIQHFTNNNSNNNLGSTSYSNPCAWYASSVSAEEPVLKKACGWDSKMNNSTNNNYYMSNNLYEEGTNMNNHNNINNLYSNNSSNNNSNNMMENTLALDILSDAQYSALDQDYLQLWDEVMDQQSSYVSYIPV